MLHLIPPLSIQSTLCISKYRNMYIYLEPGLALSRVSHMHKIWSSGYSVLYCADWPLLSIRCLYALRPLIKMHRNSVHKNVNHDWWSLFVEEAKGWKLYDSNDSFLDRIANILCFAVSPCPALSLLILTLTIMLCHKTAANVSNALILKNCL